MDPGVESGWIPIMDHGGSQLRILIEDPGGSWSIQVVDPSSGS